MRVILNLLTDGLGNRYQALMMVRIQGVLAARELEKIRALLKEAPWGDGRETAGYLSQRVKNNEQLPEASPLARNLGGMVLDALERNAQFVSAALPHKIVPPLFNRYAGGQTYGDHIDGALRPVARARVRTDLSATLFLSAPDEYEGGELAIKDSLGERRVKLPAGDLVLYPGTSVHGVTPVTSGARLASFFWIQSAIRDNEQRALLYELDRVVQELGATSAHEQSVRLAGIYHNLLRFWAEN